MAIASNRDFAIYHDPGIWHNGIQHMDHSQFYVLLLLPSIFAEPTIATTERATCTLGVSGYHALPSRAETWLTMSACPDEYGNSCALS